MASGIKVTVRLTHLRATTRPIVIPLDRTVHVGQIYGRVEATPVGGCFRGSRTVVRLPLKIPRDRKVA